MKKKLDTSGVLNELRGQSVFFPKKAEPSVQEHTQVPPSPSSQIAMQPRASKAINEPTLKVEQKTRDTVIPRYHETMIPSNHDTTIPLSEEVMIEAVRKAVKQIGKEPATQRLTLEEKQALDDIEYSYKRQGIKTSGNEIIRIATNYIVRNYRQHGEKSILAQVLHRLNS